MFRRRAPTPVDPLVVHGIVTRNVALGAAMDTDRLDRLTALTIELAGSKRWEAVGSIALSDEMIITVAANAAIPILGLDTWMYRGVHAILLRSTSTVSAKRRAGPADGVVSDDPVSIIGEAVPNAGPISIAWDSALAESRNPARGRNVVIHEFAHKIDMSDGYTDGTPPLRGPSLDAWIELVDDEYRHTEARPSDDVLRPYGWASPAEFFAVATEAFFCTGARLADAKPALYAALRDFYRQDPASAS